MKLPQKGARFVGQGITGSEGSVALEWMQRYGTQIVAGVTPGKGGQEVLGVPVFNNISEAIKSVGQVDGSVIYAPPLAVKSAAAEAIDAKIPLILIVSEKVPTQDSAYLFSLAQKNQSSIIGPASAGLISPFNQIKLGSIGGPAPQRAYVEGKIAVISKSGSMTSEISLHLKNHNLGVSWAVTIGGDRIIGTDFVDFLLALEDDPQTSSSVIFGELGGTYEERVAEFVKQGKIKKPVIGFISGDFTLSLPSEIQFGHAGAIIEGERGKPDYKRKVLKEAGVSIADEFDQIADLVKGSLKDG